MAKQYPIFDFEQCCCCHMCEQACPVSAIVLDVNGIDKWKNLYPRVNTEQCIGCSICMKNCPVDAVSMTNA